MVGGLVAATIPSLMVSAIIKKNDVVMMLLAQTSTILIACYSWLKAWP